jgi:hypothetical protein
MPTRVWSGVGLESSYSSHQFQPRAHGPLCVVLVCLGIPEVHQDPIAHELRHEAAEALHGLRDALLIDRNDLPQIFGVHARRQAVEPTKAQRH